VTAIVAMIPGPTFPSAASYASAAPISTNRTRSARGHSSSPPASNGKIITPGENHDIETRTAAVPMATTTIASTNASRRFRVRNCRRTRPRTRCAAASTTAPNPRGPRTTILPALYRHAPSGHTPDRS